MKTNWQTKKLGEIGTIFNGNSINERIKKEKYFGIEDGLPFIATKDVDFETHNIDYGNGVKIPFTEKSFKTAHANSVLICAEGGSAGKKIAFNKKDICFGNKLFAIETKKDVNSKLVYYWYLTPKFFESFKRQMNGIIGGVSIGNFKNLEIPLPPLTEQRRIVKILDEVFEKTAKAKENAEKNLQNAKELFESYLQSVFANPGKNWKEKNLGELCEVITKGTTPTSMGYKFVEKGINFIKIESIAPDGKFLPNKFAAITEECYKAFKRSQLKKGDILFSIAGALGRTAFVDENILPANTNQALAIVRLKLANNVLPKFILLSLNSGLTFGQISKFKGGVAQQNLSLEQLKNFQISLPLSSEQKSIVKKLDALSTETKKLEAIYRQKLADLDELKKSVLKKAFSGEL